jgi:ubiquinone biosynthesis monooxygenase Coq7
MNRWGELVCRGRPPCRSYHLCGLGGLALGLITGLCGRASIAATTVDVETVVLRHLEAEISALRSVDPAAVSAISSIIEDVRAQRDRAVFESAAGALLAESLRPLVSWATASSSRPAATNAAQSFKGTEDERIKIPSHCSHRAADGRY